MCSRRQLSALRFLGVVVLAVGGLATSGPAMAHSEHTAAVVSTADVRGSAAPALDDVPPAATDAARAASPPPAAHHAPTAPGDMPRAATSALPWLAIPVDVLVLALLIGRRRARAWARTESAVDA